MGKSKVCFITIGVGNNQYAHILTYRVGKFMLSCSLTGAYIFSYPSSMTRAIFRDRNRLEFLTSRIAREFQEKDLGALSKPLHIAHFRVSLVTDNN